MTQTKTVGRAENSLSEQLRQLNLHYNNITEIMGAIQEAITTDKVSVQFPIKDSQGIETIVHIPTNTHLYNELKLISENLKQLQGLTENGERAILLDQGVRRNIILSSYDRMLQNWQNVVQLEDVKLLNTSAVMNFMSPVTNIAFDLPSNILSTAQVVVKKITVNKAFITANTNSMEYQDLLQALRQSNTPYKEYDDLYDTEARVQRFYGQFDVLRVEHKDNGTLDVELESINYSDVESISLTRELDAGDFMVNKTGSSKYEVIAINKTTKVATLRRTGGFDAVSVGVKELSLTVDVESEKRRLHVPITGNSYQYIFLAPVNVDTGVRTEYSTSYRIDSDDLVVIENSARQPFNAYFNAKVQNIGAYLASLIEESTIPLSLGIKPEKPAIEAGFFQVVQINEHLMDNSDTKKVNQMLTEKSVTKAKIASLDNSIRDVQGRINAGKYKSKKERSQDEGQLQQFTSDRNEQSSYFDSLTRDIASMTQNMDLTSLQPKYRVRGFWPVAEPMFSENTRPQQIVQYIVQYRYLSPNKASGKTQRLTYKDAGKELVGSFSDWVPYPTEPLKKVKNPDGGYVWEAVITEDADKININQLDIPIRAGEKVEIRIKSVSEAGYPVSGLESDWSEIVTVVFPNDLLYTIDVIDSVKANYDDLKQAEVRELFKQKGIDEHLSTGYTERDKNFAHTTVHIASGFLTNEQTTISLFDYLNQQAMRIQGLEEKLSKRMANLQIDIVDRETSQAYSVQRNATIPLFGGYYSDTVDLSEGSNFGQIVRRIFYVRITNKSATTAELISTSPGVLGNETTNVNYRPVGIAIADQTIHQHNGQVLYLRSSDVSASIPLYSDNFAKTPVTIPDSEIDFSAITQEHNACHINSSGALMTVKIRPDGTDQNWLALHVDHPFVKEWRLNPNAANEARVKAELDRIGYFNSTLKMDTAQQAYHENTTAPFNVNDKYVIGYHSTGAKFFLETNSLSSMQVASSDAGAVRELHAGDSNALLIPITLQYRMTDALGRPNGLSTNSLNDTFEYNKLIGIDMIINNESFRFDMTIKANFRSTTVSNHDISIDKINLVNSAQTGNTTPSIT